MALTTIPYVLSDLIQESPDTFTYRIKPAAGGEVIHYKPGQFVQLHLTPDSEVKMSRSYSVASSPTTRDFIDLTIKIQGSFPQALKELREGHVFGLRGPLGHFYFDPATQPHIVLLGAGVGVTPLMGMLRYATELKLPNQVTFLDANKTEEDTIYHQELVQHHSVVNPNAKIVLSYTRLAPGHAWAGERGRIGWDMIERHVPQPLDKHYFICGPDQMNKDLKALLLEKGVPKALVKLENMGF
ncbi:MAG TPA: FAD-binding oxidoreductase [bacterium]|jgi:ferredoxin-NADP reductase|nr:FAD-binding oxidoreductase [bacterium]